jgi:glycerol-3-phosphate dehydrogenase (NAD(P)+)
MLAIVKRGTDMARIAILGAGVMGSALSYPLRDNGHAVRLIGTHLDDTIIAGCRQDGVHRRLGRALPAGVETYFSTQLAEALDNSEVIVLGVNSRGVDWAARAIAPHLRPGQIVLMVTKGLASLENGDLRIFPEVIAAQLPPELREQVPIAAIGGPSIAGELAARRETAVVFSCPSQAALDYLAPLFATSYYHIWTSTDIVGVEVCVALKNVYALGIGLVPGLLERAGGPDGGAGMHNHAAAFFAQGLAETAQMVQLMGGRIETVFSLPGAGDLYVTCQGGRNSRMGYLLGKGVDPEEASERLAGETVEGVDAVAVIAPAVDKLIARGALPQGALPLLRQIYAVAIKGRPLEPILGTFFDNPGLGFKPAHTDER